MLRLAFAEVWGAALPAGLSPVERLERFAPDHARRLLDRLEFHHTPKHASWLNMAEIEISALNRQCLNRRIADLEVVRAEAAAWEGQRNAAKIKIHWTFTIAVARTKLAKLYPQRVDSITEKKQTHST